MLGVKAVVSQMGSAPVKSPQTLSDVGLVWKPNIDPKARPSSGEGTTLKVKLISPP